MRIRNSWRYTKIIRAPFLIFLSTWCIGFIGALYLLRRVRFSKFIVKEDWIVLIWLWWCYWLGSWRWTCSPWLCHLEHMVDVNLRNFFWCWSKWVIRWRSYVRTWSEYLLTGFKLIQLLFSVSESPYMSEYKGKDKDDKDFLLSHVWK